MALFEARQRLWGRLALALGAHARARRCFEQLLQRKPDDTHALATLAFLAGASGEHHVAVRYQQRVVLIEPSSAAWYNLGFLLERCGEVVGAEEAFRKALELNERFDLAWYGLGLALASQHRTEEAMKAFRENTARQPFSPHGWEQLARLHAAQGESEQALQIVAHLHTFEPKVARHLRAELGLDCTVVPAVA